jgi:plasmid stabilization system protein ParE
MTFYFHPEAERELEDAVDYYEDHAENLGLEFSAEVFKAIQLALSMPFAWTQIKPGIRRVLVYRFPFAVLYAKNANELLILAVMHLSRSPDYWIHRVE